MRSHVWIVNVSRRSCYTVSLQVQGCAVSMVLDRVHDKGCGTLCVTMPPTTPAGGCGRFIESDSSAILISVVSQYSKFLDPVLLKREIRDIV